MKVCTSLLILTIFFVETSLFAQKHSDAETPIGTDKTLALIGRTNLFVLMQKPDEEVIEDLKKNNNTAGLEYYTNLIENYNETLKNSVEEIWGDEFRIDYKTIEDLKISSETVDNEKYLVIYTLYIEQAQSSGTSISSFYFYQFPIKAKDLKTVPASKEYKKWYLPNYEITDVYNREGDWDYALHIKPLEDFVFKPYKSDYVKVIGAIDYEMTYWNEPENFYIYSLSFLRSKFNAINNNPEKDYESFYSENAPQLKDLILVIPEEYFADDDELRGQQYGGKVIELTLTADEFESAYPYKFEIADADEFNSLIADRNPGYAYMIYSPSVRSEMSMVIMNASTGQMILVSKPKDKKNNYSLKYLIADHLTTVIEYINQ